MSVRPPPRAPLEKVFWVPNRFFKHELQPVIMGIRNGTRCLASTAAPQPTLRLQVGGGGGDSGGVGTAWGRRGDSGRVGTVRGWGLC